MKPYLKTPLFLVALASSVLTAHAADIVNDHWSDGTNTDPASPTYSENGTDVDLDGNIESAWYASSAGAIASSAGHLTMTLNTGSTGYTTYFTPTGTPVTLGIGDQMIVDWTFTPTGSGASNGSRSMRAFIGTTGTRLTGNGTPPGTDAAGYGIFTNMGVTFGVNTPLDILERTTNSANLLVNSGDYTSLGAGPGLASGNVAFVDGTTYDYKISITRIDATSLSIVHTITGGAINGTGSITNAFTDTTASTFAFDTFALRPSAAASTAATIDTTGFQVQYVAVPEPTTFAMLGLGFAFMAYWRRSSVRSLPSAPKH